MMIQSLEKQQNLWQSLQAKYSCRFGTKKFKNIASEINIDVTFLKTTNNMHRKKQSLFCEYYAE